MHRLILLLSLLGILFIAGCGGVRVSVYNAEDRRIGEIILTDEHNATFLNSYGEERGKMRGSAIRDDQGRKVGSVVERDGHVMLVSDSGEDVGTLEDGTDCYGKGDDKLGSVSADVGVETAGAACLLFFLQ